MSTRLSAVTAMRRRPAFIAMTLSLMLVVAACGGGETASDSSAAPDTTVFGETPTTSDSGSSGTTAPAAETSDTTVSSGGANEDLPDAPDFTLELGEGGEFVLSAETKPVYLVFWAEW